MGGSSNDTIFEAEDISVEFATREGIAHVLNGLGFACRRGQVIGLAGESGSGKTVLVGALTNHIRRPGKITSGKVMYDGRDLLKLTEAELQPIRGRNIGVIVSNSLTALNPLVCVGDQIANIYGSHFDATKNEARASALEAIAATGINDPERRYASYPHELSGGMAKRIIIAAALVCAPSVLIADEPTSGLDVTIQAQVLDSMAELIRQKKTAGTVLMTRDLGIIAHYCSTVTITYAGQVVEEAPVARFFDNPIHPYSRLLLASTRLDRRPGSGIAIMGPPPNKYDLPMGCLFRARCLVANETCEHDRPPLIEVEPAHLVRCWKGGELQ